jgi:sporulation protein YlmC with PRC-barrel domain
MRLSELLDAEVTDHDGSRLGKVHDVRLVQDAPAGEGRDLAFRVDALVVGRAGVAARLGYSRNEIRGPWLVRLVATRCDRRTEEIPWSDVEMHDGGIRRVRPPG